MSGEVEQASAAAFNNLACLYIRSHTLTYSHTFIFTHTLT